MDTPLPRFTGDGIPAELLKDIGAPFARAVNGFDHTDKGFVVSFDRELSSRTIADLSKKLNVQPYDWDDVSVARESGVVYYTYHIRTD